MRGGAFWAEETANAEALVWGSPWNGDISTWRPLGYGGHTASVD